MMKLILTLTIILIFNSFAYAIDIASCNNPKGKAYYPELGLMPKKHSGWEENEKITDGTTKLRKISDKNYDIIFVDATKQEISSRKDGGTVLLLNKGGNVFSFLVVYPGKTAEIFTFLKNKSGKLEYIHITSRAGHAVRIAKSALMRGECQYINFGKL